MKEERVMKRIFTLIFVSLFLLTACVNTNDSDGKKEIEEKDTITAPNSDKKDDKKEESSQSKDVQDKKNNEQNPENAQKDTQNKDNQEGKSKTRIINDMEIGDTIDHFTLTSFRDGDITEFYLTGNGTCKGVFGFDNIISGSYYIEYTDDFLADDAYLIYNEKSIPFKRPFKYTDITEEEAKNLFEEAILQRAKNGEEFDIEFKYSGFSSSQTPNEVGGYVDVLSASILDPSASVLEINDELAVIRFISENNAPEDIDPSRESLEFSYNDYNNDGKLDVACYSSLYNSYPDVKFISNKNGYYEFINTEANLLHNMDCSVYKEGDFVLCQINDAIGNDMLYLLRYNESSDILVLCTEEPIYYKQRKLVQKDEFMDSPHTIVSEITIEQKGSKPWEKFEIEKTNKIEENSEELFKSITEYTYNQNTFKYETEHIGGGFLDMLGEEE